MVTKSDLGPGSMAKTDSFRSYNTYSDEPPAAVTDKVRTNEADGDSIKKSNLGALGYKSAVLLLLIVNAVVVIVATYFFLTRQRTIEFESAFHQAAKTLTDSSQFLSSNIMSSFQGTSDYIASHAHASKQEFPFVRLPNFEFTGYHTRNASFTEYVGWSPLVTADNRLQYEQWAYKNQGWLEESRTIVNNFTGPRERHLHQRKLQDDTFDGALHGYQGEGFYIDEYKAKIPKVIHGQRTGHTGEWLDMEYDANSSNMPIWQTSPPPEHPRIINFDMFTCPVFARAIGAFEHCPSHPIITKMLNLKLYFDSIGVESHMLSHGMDPSTSEDGSDASDRPHSVLFQPVYDLFGGGKGLVGVVFGFVSWDKYFSNLLPEGDNGIYCVVENSCNQSVTYVVNGKTVDYLGTGDCHKTDYDHLKVETKFVPLQHAGGPPPDECEYTFSIYPSDEFRMMHYTNQPEIFTGLLSLLFLVTVVAFGGYVRFIQYRQDRAMEIAEQSSSIVNSLFPSSVRDRLMEEARKEAEMKRRNSNEAPKTKLKRFLSVGGQHSEEVYSTAIKRTKPIADLFPEATVMFADIVGFTAWSSVREPAAVFELLETLYAAFDDLARQRAVFKVETIGDCYVSVCGLPEPCKDHAVVMAKFAVDCLNAMSELTTDLETSLGPDTGDLSMRVGLHSGPVTAGVLRGDRSRFQLFGDTVNTASRMESTGKRDSIQISQETADLLIAAGHDNWITLRNETIEAKGKGKLQTYWLDTTSPDSSDGDETVRCWESASLDEENFAEQLPCNSKVSAKTLRLIEWNVDQLLRLIKQIVARRQTSKTCAPGRFAGKVFMCNEDGSTVFDEVKEVVTLPKFDAKTAKKYLDPESIDIESEVVSQLTDYVTKISMMYRQNSFHNFEHASHVTQSVIKLLGRIVAPGEIQVDVNGRKGRRKSMNLASHLHDFSYGITSDPVTQFAVVLSALIHDVDHCGLPNSQLVKEQVEIASKYRNQSVAEQNSVDLSWKLLMQPEYQRLRRHIYCSEEEAMRFRQLVVNSVMATDIIDADLKELRNSRWDKVFADGTELLSDEDVNRKATIVIEHMIQASDVSHTMQHWHVYRRWNERLFQEMYSAYQNGRAEKDPAEFWYKGELGFFDYYIIPLARKLKECGCFGVFSDEYLNYALENRAEWEKKGESVLQEMIERVRNKAPSKDISKDESRRFLSNERLLSTESLA